MSNKDTFISKMNELASIIIDQAGQSGTRTIDELIDLASSNYFRLETLDFNAYQIPVSSLSYPNAAINKIGGMTYTSVNLLPVTDGQTVASGVTITKSGTTGIYNYNGTCTSTGNSKLDIYKQDKVILKANKTYHIYAYGLDSNFSTIAFYDDYTNTGVVYLSANASYKTYTPTANVNIYAGVNIISDVTYNNKKIYIGIYEEAKSDYIPYYSGFRNSIVTVAQSRGENILNIPDAEEKTKNGLTYKIESGIIYVGGASTVAYTDIYRANITSLLVKGNTYTFWNKNNSRLCYAQIDITKDDGSIKFISLTDVSTLTFTVPYNTKDIVFGVYGSGSILNTEFSLELKLMLVDGETAPTEFKPYISDSFIIPTEIQQLDGYGKGVNELYYNYIDFDRKVYVQRCFEVDMGDLNVYAIGTGANARITILRPNADILKPVDNATIPDIKFSNRFSPDTADNTYLHSSDRTVAVNIDSGHLAMYDSEFMDKTLDEIKTAITGIKMLYCVTTPIETDISNLLPADNFINVENKTTIIFDNEYHNDVPSQVTFQRKVGFN